MLAELVRSYIREAEPVGSKALEARLGVSSATIRNEMCALEEAGYLAQPHTSAGRVPTLKAYELFVEHMAKPKEPGVNEQKAIREAVEQAVKDVELGVRSLAKQLAHVSGEAVVVGFTSRDVYYTGLSNLFAQPEFGQVEMVRAMGNVIDHLDEAMLLLYSAVGESVEVMLGQQNPFGEDCAVVCTSCRLGNTANLIGFLGPVRMDYDANLGRLHYVKQLIAR